MIDDLRSFQGFAFARCSYFTIECDTPSPNWYLGLADRRIPFLMVGLSGIIHQPSEVDTVFTSPEQIEALFAAIEEGERFFVGSADLWVPSKHMKPILEQDRPRGLTFRMGYELFLHSLDYRRDRITRRDYEAMCGELHREITPSPSESTAFASWRRRQVNMAKERYPKSRELALQFQTPDNSAPDTRRSNE
jgi:hypothetical protein